MITLIKYIKAHNIEVINTMSGLVFIFVYILFGIAVFKIGIKIKKLKNKRVLQE